MILCIGAMDIEISGLIDLLSHVEASQAGPFPVHTGLIGRQSIAVAKSGVGKAAAAICTALLIERYAPRLVLNIGVAGGVAQDMRVGSLAVASGMLYHDVDVTHFGYAPGQLPGCPAVFDCDPDATALLHACARDLYGADVFLGRIASGDAFIANKTRAAQIAMNCQAVAVEMEGAAIAQACTLFGVPFCAARSISDTADSAASAEGECEAARTIRLAHAFLQRRTNV